MYSVGSKACTEDGIIAIGRRGSDDVRRVDILNICFDVLLFKVLLDLLFKEESDVSKYSVAREILASCLWKDVLPRALCNEYYSVSA